MAEKGKSEIAKREEKTLAFWQDNKIFEKSLDKSAPAGEFVFYDGPPFATGLPHYGHILPGTIKDVIPRYKTMCGFRVPRRWGWDCHGLPVENLVEKELGLATKKEIEKFGIEKFNERARASVLTYEKEWREIIPRTGRWVDMSNAYKTMDPGYTEAVWWSFKNLYEKNLIYRGFKSMHLCPRCETTLSNFEVSQGYKDITDISVYVKFELVDEPNTFLLAWTTTPWTLPGNAALAVRVDGTYSILEIKNRSGEIIKIVLEENCFRRLLGTEAFPISLVVQFVNEKTQHDRDWFILNSENILGDKLVGKRYKSPFPYYQTEGRVVEADFVSTEEGTGIVHIAPAFGEEDYQLSLREHLPLIQHVGTDGRFRPEVTDFAGELVKPKDDHQITDIKIIKYLAAKNLLFAKEKIVHSYPHCWRCDTPLLNYAASSWFLKVTDQNLKEKIIEENKKIKWMPTEIGAGRFGKWLEGARDWAISRSRYWGAPLPVWVCEGCGNEKVIGGLEELKGALPRSGNKYFLMRHGEAESNVRDVITCDLTGNPLTATGKTQTEAAARALVAEKIGLIISSDLVRTRETAEIIAKNLNYDPAKIIYDERLRELNFGAYNGQSRTAYRNHFTSDLERFSVRPLGGENLTDLRRRVHTLLYELEAKYQNINILIVSHGDPTWLMQSGDPTYLQNGEIKLLAFSPLPHNADFELDLHRPYIDEVRIKCEKCAEPMRRVPEVFDTWYDSGSVPFASQAKHELVAADFIAEGLDQTRGWFYTLLVLATALFGESAYKRVVVNGLILAEDGKKMSKKLQNYPELTEMLDKFGADALRYYLLASPAVRAEDLAFSERGLDEVAKKLILRLENVLSFYELYQAEAETEARDGSDVLDHWILARLNQLRQEVTDGLEAYQLDQAARPLALFVDDLSTWYLRRSRKRAAALPTLRRVLLEFAKISAPFLPFLAEEIHQKLKDANGAESVHLEEWPPAEKIDEQILAQMAEVRRLVSLGLELRAKNNLKIRQPLAGLTLKNKMAEALSHLLKDELNVKTITFDADLAEELSFDLNLTPELREEGELRDLVRLIQAERKKQKLVPGQMAELILNPDKKILLGKSNHQSELQKACSLRSINFSDQCPIGSIKLKV